MPIHNLNHVNMFLQVIASGSISSAARILRKSHTAVSSAVSNLEIDLCVELVRRDGYKVEPTEQALRLIPYMRSLLNYQQLIGDIAFNLNKGPRNLRVLLDTAIPPSFCDTVSSVLLDDFNMVSLIRTSPADSLATIKQDNAEIDIAITIDEELKISRFNQCVLGYTKAFVVAHPQHPLCNASLHSIASLANYRQISLGSRSGQHSNLLRPVSDKVLFVENFDDMLRLVEAGVGWGIAPHYFVEERLRNGTLAVLSELYEPGGIDRCIATTTPRWNPSAASCAFSKAPASACANSAASVSTMRRPGNRASSKRRSAAQARRRSRTASAPHQSRAFSSRRWPWVVRIDSGWNCKPSCRLRGSAIAMISPSASARQSKPSGRRLTTSEW